MDVNVYTDASDMWWGIVTNTQTYASLWTPEELPNHIYYKDLKTGYLATLPPELQGWTISILSDNTMNLAYIRPFGGTRSPHLMNLSFHL